MKTGSIMATNQAIRYLQNLAVVLLLSGILSADTGATSYLCQALNDLCADIQNLIPVVAMLLVVTAGVVYSAGQMFGAETRARATVWATSCLTGAVIGILISVIAPSILSSLAGTTVTCSSGTNSGC